MRIVALRLRESFWFLPSLFGVLAIVLGESLIYIDHLTAGQAGYLFATVGSLTPSGGRSILSVIGTSTLTVAATSFSITISVLATTSSTYGPRLVRNFLADRANQLVLAVFTSTFLYSLVVLRSVRSESDGGSAFVPSIAVLFAVVLAVTNVAFLVFFIHHIAQSVQITTLQREVQNDLLAVASSVYGDDAPGVRAVPRPDGGHRTVAAARSGYVQDIDLDALVRLARQHDCALEVVAMPGCHVIADEPLAHAFGISDDAKFDKAVAAAFALGTARTPRQDIRFAVQQMVEIAVRGLASGSNDPYTAVSALDLSATALVPLWRGPNAPTARADSDGNARVWVRWPEPEELVTQVFEGISTYGLEHPLVIEAALALADRLHAASAERAPFLETLTRGLRNAGDH